MILPSAELMKTWNFGLSHKAIDACTALCAYPSASRIYFLFSKLASPERFPNTVWAKFFCTPTSQFNCSVPSLVRWSEASIGMSTPVLSSQNTDSAPKLPKKLLGCFLILQHGTWLSMFKRPTSTYQSSPHPWKVGRDLHLVDGWAEAVVWWVDLSSTSQQWGCDWNARVPALFSFF